MVTVFPAFKKTSSPNALLVLSNVISSCVDKIFTFNME